MDQIKLYHVSKENALVQLKPSALPCVAVMLSLPIPSVFTDHNLQINEDFWCHNFENILEVKGFSLLYSWQMLLTGRDLLNVYHYKVPALEGFPLGWMDCLMLNPVNVSS